MTSPQTLLLDQGDGVLTITLNRPDKRNAYNATMLDELVAALNDANHDPAVRCLVLTGAGKVFCAGGDLKELVGGRGPLQIHGLLTTLIKPLVARLRTLDKPVIASLNGPVAGGALPLALAADLVVASEGASFVTAFRRIGAMPDAATLYLLAQNIGQARTRALVLRGQDLTAAQALALGLYHQVVPAAALAGATAELAAELAAGPTMAFAMAKQALRDAARLPFDAYMDLEASSQALLHTSHDHAEGVQAFLEKRPPRFTGT